MRRPDCCDSYPNLGCPAEGCGQRFCSTWHLELHLRDAGHAPPDWGWTFRW